MGDPEGSKLHLSAGLEAVCEGDPESYAPLLIAMRSRATIILGDDDAGLDGLLEAEAMLASLSLPRRAQVMVVLAMSYQALEQNERALSMAREAARIAALRGFRLWNLVAQSIVSVCTEGEASTEARNHAVELATEMCELVPPKLVDSFRERPRIRALLSPFEASDDEIELGDPE
jgi:hypothetical protein